MLHRNSSYAECAIYAIYVICVIYAEYVKYKLLVYGDKFSVTRSCTGARQMSRTMHFAPFC